MADFTVAEFLDWCRSKPAGETYCFTDAGNCALSQYGRATGRPELVDLPLTFPVVGDAVSNALCGHKDWTFGALVTRLEAIVQETPAKPSVWLSPQTYVDADCGSVPA